MVNKHDLLKQYAKCVAIACCGIEREDHGVGGRMLREKDVCSKVQNRWCDSSNDCMYATIRNAMCDSGKLATGSRLLQSRCCNNGRVQVADSQSLQRWWPS